MKRFKELKLNQLVAGLIVTSAGIEFGMMLAWTATAFPYFDEELSLGVLSPTQKSLMASLATVGGLISCPISGALVDKLGRRGTLHFLTALLGLPGWALLSLGNSPWLMYGGRILTGMCSSGYCVVVPVFIRELSSPDNRGLLGSLFLFMICVGKLVSMGLGVLLPVPMASLICALYTPALCVALCLIPESPVYLTQQGRHVDAQSASAWLLQKGGCLFTPYSCFRSSPLEFESPVSTTTPSVLSSKQNVDERRYSRSNGRRMSVVQHFTFPQVWKPALTTFFLMAIAQLCGIILMTFYTVEIFQSVGESVVDPKLGAVLLTVVQLLGCIPASLFVDRYGRRLLFLLSFAVLTASQGVLGGYLYAKEVVVGMEETLAVSWIPIVCLVTFYLGFAWGVGNVVFVTASELLPPQILASASAIGSIFIWGGTFISSFTFQMWKEQVALSTWFFIYSGICGAAGVVTWVVLPETKGKTLAEIQSFYSKSSSSSSSSSAEVGKGKKNEKSSSLKSSKDVP